jgi:hypothetical protein
MVEVGVASCKGSAGDIDGGMIVVAIVETHPEHIDGPWIDGFVLDRHVISSRPIGYAGEHMQFETTRSPLGELVYQLKYRNGQLDDIVETAVAFVAEHWGGNTDCVVSPPPSLHRTRQPAVLIAEGSQESRSAIPAQRCRQNDGNAADEKRAAAGARAASERGHPAGD